MKEVSSYLQGAQGFLSCGHNIDRDENFSVSVRKG